VIKFQCKNKACRLYHKEYRHGSDQTNPGRCLSCRLPMSKIWSIDTGIGDDLRKKARAFLDATDGPGCATSGPQPKTHPWGKGITEIISEAGTVLDEQEIPLTGRSLFVPGYGFFEQEEDPESVKPLPEDDQIYEEPSGFGPDIVELMEENDQINKAFLVTIRSAHSRKAFFVEARLRELHRELLAIVNTEEGD